uniref:Uncharacterized protein n=1 Tax=Tetranychus urticae TaxID=32264 RepID=T1KDJ0_TETUR
MNSQSPEVSPDLNSIFNPLTLLTMSSSVQSLSKIPPAPRLQVSTYMGTSRAGATMAPYKSTRFLGFLEKARNLVPPRLVMTVSKLSGASFGARYFLLKRLAQPSESDGIPSTKLFEKTFGFIKRRC